MLLELMQGGVPARHTGPPAPLWQPSTRGWGREGRSQPGVHNAAGRGVSKEGEGEVAARGRRRAWRVERRQLTGVHNADGPHTASGKGNGVGAQPLVGSELEWEDQAE